MSFSAAITVLTRCISEAHPVGCNALMEPINGLAFAVITPI
jgi:hypothetical protein